jgi:putative RecB family exonuclease
VSAATAQTPTRPGTARPASAGAPEDASPDTETVAAMIAEVGRVRTAGGSDLDRLPKRLSPSRAKVFAHCPQAFYFTTICGLKEPGSIQTTRGTVAHAAFERTFDAPAGERTVERSLSYIAPAWASMVDPDLTTQPEGSADRARTLEAAAEYRRLAPAGSAEEQGILEYAAQMIRNWYAMERVNNFTPTGLAMPDGSVVDGRELHVGADMFGVHLHGFIDRLDRWTAPDGTVRWAIADYKTGKVPGAGKTYSPATMDRIAWDAMFQLRVYAVLAWEVYRIPVTRLRLIYVNTGDREHGIKQLTVDQKILDRTRAEVRSIWTGITRSARTGTWKTSTGPLCNYCYFQDICPAFGNALPVTEIIDAA